MGLLTFTAVFGLPVLQLLPLLFCLLPAAVSIVAYRKTLYANNIYYTCCFSSFKSLSKHILFIIISIPCWLPYSMVVRWTVSSWRFLDRVIRMGIDAAEISTLLDAWVLSPLCSWSMVIVHLFIIIIVVKSCEINYYAINISQLLAEKCLLIMRIYM